MKFNLFLNLLRYAMMSKNFKEFVDSVHKIEGYTDDVAATGILFSIWHYSVDHSCNKLRELTGWSRAKFCREYALPVRTIENWEHDKSFPGYHILDLLAFAVMSDLHGVSETESESESESETNNENEDEKHGGTEG